MTSSWYQQTKARKDAAREGNELNHVVEDLLAVLDNLAKGNTHPMPVTMTYLPEDQLWVVDVSVKIPRVTNYDLTSSGTTIQEAVLNAAKALRSHHEQYQDKGRREAKKYGYAL